MPPIMLSLSSAQLQTVMAAAMGGRAAHDVVAVHDRLYLVIAEPARFAEEVLGTLSVGYALDDTVAEQLAAATHCEVNLVVGSHLCATSLPAAERAAEPGRGSVGERGGGRGRGHGGEL